jgi:RNase adapter protein RapZ
MMTGKIPKEVASASKVGVRGESTGLRAITVMSFGYKEGPVPLANVVFDVRFLKNPYWVPELRPLTGMDLEVRKYVCDQISAMQFLDSLMTLLENIIPRFKESKMADFSIAFGCTGGQHRSVSLAETLAERLTEVVADCEIILQHRELGRQRTIDGGGEGAS